MALESSVSPLEDHKGTSKLLNDNDEDNEIDNDP